MKRGPFVADSGQANDRSDGRHIDDVDRLLIRAGAAVVVRNGQRDDVGAVIIRREAEVRLGTMGIILAVLRDLPGVGESVPEARINHQAGERKCGPFVAGSGQADDGSHRIHIGNRDDRGRRRADTVIVGNAQADGE